MKLLFALLLATSAGAAPPRILLGYFDNWTPAYSVAGIEKSGAAAHLTHIAYAFADVHAGACALSKPQVDARNIPALFALRKRHPQLKLLISVGGASATNSAAFAAASKSKEGRAKLAASCINLFLKGDSKFDGIDLDWEFPEVQDKSNFTALIAEFRAQCDAAHRHYLLTVAAPAGRQNYSSIELATVAAHLDFLNLMTYDYNGTWSKQTAHAASLASVAATVNDYRDAGVPASQIVLGIPFFGQGWTGVAPANHGLYQPAAKPAPAPAGDILNNPGHASFRTLNNLRGFAGFDDPDKKAHWIYNARTRTFWSFDDRRIILEKIRYLRAQGLAGAMVWDLKDDTPNASLIKTIAAAR